MRRVLAFCAAALLMPAGGAVAASLDKETCDKLKAELAQIETTDARVNMIKGPDWAKTNLGPDKLGEVKRLIEVEELLLFRCQGRPLVVLPPESDLEAIKGEETKEDGKEAAKEALKDAKATAAEKGAPAKKPALQPAKAAPPKDVPAKKADASVKGVKSGSPAPAKAVKAKPRVDDAYRPPGQDPTADSFAKQLPPAEKK